MWRAEDKPDETMTLKEIIEELKEDQGDTSLREYAKTVGCTASYLSQVYNGVRPPSETLLTRINIERQTTYSRTKRRWK